MATRPKMQRPVVILPGYYGSELVDTAANDFEVWLTDNSLLHPVSVLNAIRLDTGDPARIVASGPLDHFSLAPFLHVGVYSQLRQFLRDKAGYASSQIHAFGIDWRQSLTTLADHLRDQLDAIGTTVDLVAHSHGGLVARAYLQRHGAGKVQSLVTIGTPHKGMLKTFLAISEGFRFLTFPPDHLRRTARSFPSAYELLPSDPADGLFTWNGQPDDPFARPEWCETTSMRTLLAAAGQVVHALPAQLPVEASFIYGTHLSTTTRCVGSPTALTFTEDQQGDSTVPLVSARGDGMTSAAVLRRYPIPYGVHGSLFADPDALDLLRLILTGQPPTVWFVARWSSGRQPFAIYTENTLVVEVRDALGALIPGTKVTLRFAGGNTMIVPQTPLGDFVLDVTMPGAGSRLSWTVEAVVPAGTFRRKGVLVAANN